MKLITKFYGFFSAQIENLKGVFDGRDILIFGGLFFIGYGLYQLYPWLGLTVFGVVSMLLGLGWIIRVPK
jgi:hypothetical protein